MTRTVLAAALAAALLTGACGADTSGEATRAAPEFMSEAHDGTMVRVPSPEGHAVVLFFYPKDDTPG